MYNEIVMNATRNKKIQSVIKHRKKVADLYKYYFGKVPMRAKLHDLDKLLMLYIGVSPIKASKIHRKVVKHHRFINKPNKMKWNDKVEIILDWESARYTKPDKPLTARETMVKHYPHLENYLSQTLDSFNL